jgi:hypothetical protein
MTSFEAFVFVDALAQNPASQPSGYGLEEEFAPLCSPWRAVYVRIIRLIAQVFCREKCDR